MIATAYRSDPAHVQDVQSMVDALNCPASRAERLCQLHRALWLYGNLLHRSRRINADFVHAVDVPGLAEKENAL